MGQAAGEEGESGGWRGLPCARCSPVPSSRGSGPRLGGPDLGFPWGEHPRGEGGGGIASADLGIEHLGVNVGRSLRGFGLGPWRLAFPWDGDECNGLFSEAKSPS